MTDKSVGRPPGGEFGLDSSSEGADLCAEIVGVDTGNQIN